MSLVHTFLPRAGHLMQWEQQLRSQYDAGTYVIEQPDDGVHKKISKTRFLTDDFCAGKEIRVEKESTELLAPPSGTHTLQVFPQISTSTFRNTN